MTFVILCQASAMAAAVDLGHDVDDLPACDEPAAVPVRGWWLCDGCAEALEILTEFTRRHA